jgi:serine protease Do
MSAERFHSKALVLVLSALVLSGCSRPAAAVPPVMAAAPSSAPAPASGPVVTGLPDFTALVDHYGPAVVNIRVIEKRVQTQAQSRTPEGGQNDPFSDFFRRFGIPNPNGGNGQRGNEAPRGGTGSGFIVTPDGYIMTNAHVVRGASEVTVKTTDRREYSAKVIGIDDRTDVAVIKIEAKNLPTVKIGDPDLLRPGQWVIAIGSPFDMENSVTAGIVSATSRTLPGDPYVPFIQTDVAVNPGNSGGPLFNMNGEVVGINSQIYSQTGGYMGLSFAIPINVANDVRGQLISTGKVSRGRIGVGIETVTAAKAEAFGLDRPRGALIGSVESGGPAEKAGVKPGDIIISVDGHAVERDAEVPALISGIKPGKEVALEVWRDRNVRKLSARVVEVKEEGTTAANNERGEGGGSAEPSALGLSVHPLQPDERREAGIENGLLVDDVSGAAEDAGIRPGDIVLGVNGTAVRSVAELQTAAKRSGKKVALRVQRENRQFFLVVTVP